MVQEPGSLDALIPLTGTQATDALLAGVGSAVSHVLLMLIAAAAVSLLVNAGAWLWGSSSGHHYMGYTEPPPSPYGDYNITPSVTIVLCV